MQQTHKQKHTRPNIYNLLVIHALTLANVMTTHLNVIKNVPTMNVDEFQITNRIQQNSQMDIITIHKKNWTKN